MYVAKGVLLKEREESVCRGRSDAEEERGECISRKECCGARVLYSIPNTVSC